MTAAKLTLAKDIDDFADTSVNVRLERQLAIGALIKRLYPVRPRRLIGVLNFGLP
jgi:hypothetical protein